MCRKVGDSQGNCRNQAISLKSPFAVMLSWISAFPANKAVPRYVVAKDDVSQQILNSATFYTVGAGGTPSPATTVLTRAGDGIAGGFTTRTTTALHARNTCGTCGKLAMFNGEFKKVL